MTSASIPSSLANLLAASNERCTTAPYVITVTSVPSRTTRAFPKGIMKFGPGLGALLYVWR